MGFHAKYWEAEIHSPVGSVTVTAQSFDSLMTKVDSWGKMNSVILTPDLLFNVGFEQPDF